jgi:hypothetical protein
MEQINNFESILRKWNHYAKVLCIWVETKQRLLRRRREATGNFGRRFERADEWDNYMHFYEAINKTSSICTICCSMMMMKMARYIVS